MSYRDLQKKVASLSMRERILVCLVGVALFVFPGYLSFVDRYKTDTRRTQDSMGARGAELAEVQEELAKWQGMLTQNPNDVLAHNHLGSIYFSKKEYDKAMEVLEKRLERMMPWNYLENQAKMTEHMLNIQKNVPLGIYVI